MQSAWLVDMGYVVKTSAKGLFKLDYTKAAEVVARLHGPPTTFLFNGYDTSYGVPEGLKSFYHAMESQGMKVCLHPMSSDSGGGRHVQRRVDVDFAAHLIWQASLPTIEHIVLTTGDQDMIPALEIAKREYKKRVVLFSFDRDVHADLRKIVDNHLFFETFKTEIARR